MEFKLLMVFIDDSRTDAVMKASREAGATGATIVSAARGQGLNPRKGLFGLEILDPRDVILVLVEARRSARILAAIETAGGLDDSLETGIALEIDVAKAVGLSEHIAALAQQKPPA